VNRRVRKSKIVNIGNAPFSERQMKNSAKIEAYLSSIGNTSPLKNPI